MANFPDVSHPSDFRGAAHYDPAPPTDAELASVTQPRKPSPFLEEVRAAIRVRRSNIRTERTYLAWIVRFIRFHKMRHPRDMGEAEVVSFLSHLAVEKRVAASTQNQALNPLVFLYKAVLERPLGDMQSTVRAKRPQRLPDVLTPYEVGRILQRIDYPYWLAACLMYGSGLRVMETVRLRVKDLDFYHRGVLVRDGKGGRTVSSRFRTNSSCR